jgi:ketosteroid isomerase-like protein
MRGLQAWLDGYRRAWLSNDPADVGALFADDAVYSVDPFREPWRGRDEIVERWTSDPEQQDDVRIHMTPLAVNGDSGLAHWSASYVRRSGRAARIRMDGVLLLEFAGDRRCRVHREWYARREEAIDG